MRLSELKKKIMNRSCLTLLTNSVNPLIILFLLCQSAEPATENSTDIAEQNLPPDERSALSTFIYNLNLPTQYVPDFYCDKVNNLIDATVTIKCTSINNIRHVTEIIFSGVGLDGYIDAAVKDLEYLEILDLSNNKIQGYIPSELGNLSLLTNLDLSSNKLTGSIPHSLGHLPKLAKLHLQENFLSGSIPTCFGDLSSLKQMYLGSNRLSGSIPSELGKLGELEELSFSENELNGSLPTQLGQLINLKFLHFSANNFTGNLPDQYKNLTNMESFSISGNYLNGSFPNFVTTWVNLYVLHLLGNNFEAELPSEIFNMANLQYLIVSDMKNHNGFQLPRKINLTKIHHLVLRNCNIIGQIPSFISDQYPYLSRLDLSFNNFTGAIPNPILNVNSSNMFLSLDVINQRIVRWINRTVTFKGGISYNNFTFEAAAASNLVEAVRNSVNLSNINIEPNKRESLHQIMDNRCGGEKSKHDSLFINAGGERINFEQNVFDEDNSTLLTTLYENSKKPWAYSCLGEFGSTNYIQNVTCGVSLPELYLKARLCPQSLTYYGFCLRNGHYNVKLHFAEIVFAKDEDYSSLGKRVFDIYIQGKPERRDFNIKEKTGNTPNKKWIENFTDINVHDNLLEIRLFWAGKGSNYYPFDLTGPLISAISVTRKIKPLPIAWIMVASLLTALLLLVLVLALMWRMGYLGDRELRVTKVELRGKSYTVKQVKDATRNFSPKNKTGKGRFGMIYKAQLPDQTVAVKKLSVQSDIDQIRTEVYALKQLKHDNLVELLDVYSKKDLHLLIYEYMEKGSLKQVLFDESNSKVILDWPQRFNICLGIARGLKYLHQDRASGKYVHRNVKASNILLDGNLNPKISDFGLAKLYDEENPYAFIREIGTVVYMAPECATRKGITDKADVYSYGILLLEIVSGKSNSKSEDNDYLLNKACVLYSKGMPMNLVDTNLSGDYDKKQARTMLELAIKCTNVSPDMRPTMLEIVSELEQISAANTPSSSA